jgi:hypothetical protein
MIVRLFSVRFYLHPLLLGVAILTFSCDKETAPDCLKSTGKTVRQIRPVSAFSEIVLHDDINLYLTHNTDSTLTIEAGENLLPKVETIRNGNTLTIRNRNTCNWARSYKRPINVTIGVPQTDLVLTHRGFGKIQSAGPLDIGYLTISSFDAGGDVQLEGELAFVVIYCNSAAHITLAGQAQYLQAWLHNSIGRLSAQSLRTTVCNLTHEGNNEMRVFPVDELNVTISANGTVAYYNEPLKITQEVGKEGKLVKRKF